MWNERYAEADFAYGIEPNLFLQSLDFAKASGKVSCLAEGQGRNAVYLAAMGFDVEAIDSSNVGLKRAEELAFEKGVSIRTTCIDLLYYKFTPNSLDGVISIFGHFPPHVRKKINSQIVQALKPGGFIVMEAYTPDQLKFNSGGPKLSEMLYSLKLLQEDLGEGLKYHVAKECQRDIQEGGYHSGIGAVVQIYAIKE